MEPNVRIFTDEYWTREIKYSILRFSGGEIQIRLLNPEIKSGRVSLVTNITSSDILMEVLLLTDALRRNGISQINLVTKYFPYARQDRVCYPGESLSLKIVCDIINSQNYEKVTIMDAHSDVTPALLNNVVNLDCGDFVGKIVGLKDYILVSPDAGAAKKVMKTAKRYNVSMVTAEKVRDPNDGAILQTKVDIQFAKGQQDFLIVDDICDGGRTFIELAKVLREYTNGRIVLYVTHGIFSAGFAELEKHIDHIYTPNPLRKDLPAFVTTL